jgi:hypothetical protein
MYSRAATLGVLAAVAYALPVPSTPTFSLHATGAVTLGAAGHDARFGIIPQAVRGRPILLVSLGATGAAGALQLSVAGDRAPAPGRYPIRSAWDEQGSDTNSFHAAFLPGTADRPRGWYHGESGWVTITKSEDGRIAGGFEISARGFATVDPADEDRWVTVRGSFDAQGDSTVRTIAAAR